MDIVVFSVLGHRVVVAEVMGLEGRGDGLGLGEIRCRPDYPSGQARRERWKAYGGLGAGGQGLRRKLPGNILPLAPGGESARADYQGE